MGGISGDQSCEIHRTARYDVVAEDTGVSHHRWSAQRLTLARRQLKAWTTDDWAAVAYRCPSSDWAATHSAGTPTIEGAPANPGFGKQIFGVKKDRSIVPHGHSNMCTGFIVLRGEFHGRHYDRLETHKDHYIIKPTIDRTFKPGELSTISDHKDNVHWFKCASETGFIFNVHVIGYDSSITEASGRLYLDPEGEKLSGGLVKAKKMTSSECHKKYG